VPRYLSRRKANLISAAQCNDCSRIAYLPALAAPFQFHGAYTLLSTFFSDELFDGLAGSFSLKLPQVAVLRFFQDVIDKIASAQNAFIKLFLLSSPPHGQHLGPAALASDQSAAGQSPVLSLADSFSHELAIFTEGFPAGVAELDQNVLSIHPGALCLADDASVSAPGVMIQSLHGFDYTGPDGIEVDVPD